MKTYTVLFLAVLAAFTAVAHPPPPPRATEAEALAGVNNFKYMTPALVTTVAQTIGGATNAILKADSSGTNTTLHTAKLITPTGTNATFYNTNTFYGTFVPRGAASASALQMGHAAVASGSGSLAIGQSATASDSGIAIGNGAAAAVGNGIAIGIGADASEHSVALGDGAQATAAFAAALGDAAVSTNASSTAVGEGAITTVDAQIRLGKSTSHVSIPGGLSVTGSAGFTNANVTSAFPYGDAAGKQGEATAANFIATVGGTPDGSKVLRDDWTWVAQSGGGTGSNGVSYVSAEPAIRTLLDGADEIFEILYPDGVTAGGITNDTLVLQSHAGYATAHIILGTESVLGGSDVYMKEGGRAAFRATANSRQIFASDGTTVVAEWNTYDAPVIGSLTYDQANWEDGGVLWLDGSTVRASTALPITTLNATDANIGNMYVTNRLTITNSIRQPFFELVSTGNETNYTVDWAATVPDNNIINATGNVYFAVIDSNLVGGVTKQYVITNVFWGSSNTTVYVQTNLMHLHGQTYTVGASPMHTNYAIPNTNFVVLNLQSVGSTPQSILSFFVNNQP